MKMAQQQAPPAAQAPIVVVVDEVQITSDAALVLAPGAQHVKDHTPCLSWTTVYDNAGAVTNYTLGQSDAKGAFLPRCRFSVDQQTGTLLDGNHVLNVLFNGAFWSRLLTALDAANLFATSMEKIGVLHQRLAGLAMANPGVWVVSHSDIFLGEDFDAPAVPAPVAGRGRGRGRGGPAAAAVPAVLGPQDLVFLTQLPLRALEAGGELPLLLYSLLDGDSRYLKQWLRMCPRNQITVLDTHDGICIPDVEGVLPHDKIQHVIDNVSARSADPILRRSAANVHSVGAIYQLTCTYYDALKQNDDAYIAARAIQFFAPGVPQVYYVGLLGGTNDIELMESTGELRDIYRQWYAREDIDAAMKKTVVRRLLKLMEFRTTYPAFDGTFHLQYSNESSVCIEWRKGEFICNLFVDLIFKKTTIRYVDPKSKRMLTMTC